MCLTEIVLEIQTPGILRVFLSQRTYNVDVLEVKEGSNLSVHPGLAVR